MVFWKNWTSRNYLDEFTFGFNHRKAEDSLGLVILILVIATGIKHAEFLKDDPEPYSGPRSSYAPW
jgi:hypothetical protein